MDILLKNKNSIKIYDIIREGKNVIYVYLDKKENIDDLFIEKNANLIKQKNKGEPKPLTLKYLREIFELEKAMCKTKFQDKGKGKLEIGFGSGCFIQLNQDDFPFKRFLLTNHHILDENKIEGNKELDIYYRGRLKKINILKRKRYTSKDLDYICIEIFEEDNIQFFYNIDQRIFENDPNFFTDEDIFVLHYPFGGDLSFSVGKILSIKDSIISHNCTTEGGLQGRLLFQDIIHL